MWVDTDKRRSHNITRQTTTRSSGIMGVLSLSDIRALMVQERTKNGIVRVAEGIDIGVGSGIEVFQCQLDHWGWVNDTAVSLAVTTSTGSNGLLTDGEIVAARPGIENERKSLSGAMLSAYLSSICC